MVPVEQMRTLFKSPLESTLALRLYSILAGGIGWIRRAARTRHCQTGSRTCVLMKMGADEIAQRAIWSCSSSCDIASHIIPVLHRD